MTTKLAVPRLPPGLVLRSRLMDRLSDGAAGRVTLVSAGPGWGKTMLVAAWARARDSSEPLAWLSLDSFDNDPVLFWSSLAAAVHGTGLAPEGPLGEFRISAPVGKETVRRIILGLAELPGSLTLVLDDFGEIRNQEILEGVSDLVRYPLPVRLVVITRTDPSLHLQRLRVEGELVEVRAADLAFTVPECDALLDHAGVALPVALTQRLRDRTDGWAAGLRLAALFAAGPCGSLEIEKFADGDTGVAEYFAEEVLGAMTDEQLRFMLRTSVADRLCADLADVLSGRGGGQRVLEDLEQANAFVVALGSGHEWFRYHPLLVDVLRHRLTREDPELADELHRRAARWCAVRGDALAAVRHASRARDWQLVGELMVSVAAIRALSVERLAFAALLAEVPAGVIDSSPELRATAAVRCFIAGDYDGFANHAFHARTLSNERDEVSRRPVEVFLCVADMVVSRVGGDESALIAATTQLLQWLSEPPMSDVSAVAQFEAPALSNLGVGLVWSARMDEAEKPLRASLGVAADARAALTGVNSLGYLALIELERGHLRAAEAMATEGRETAERRSWTEQAQVVANYLVLAHTELERNNLHEAQHLLDAALAAHRNDPERIASVALQSLQARLWLATGLVARARQAITALNAATDVGEAPPLLHRSRALVSAEIDLADGRAQSALNSLQAVLEEDESGSQLHVCRARARLALGDTAAAEAELDAIQGKSDNPIVVTRAWLLTALAADHLRDDHRAMTALNRALVAAEPENIRLPFVTLGHHRLEAMLRHLLHLSPPGDEAARDFAALVLDDIDTAVGTSVVITALAEPLTDRERTVLIHMATLKTNLEIAAELYVSINTVKSHARSVYRKLQVTSRREAVHQARERGML